MKVVLLLLIVLVGILIPSVSYSQTKKDTVCINIDDAIRKLRIADSVPVLRYQISLLEVDKQTLLSRIETLKNAADAYQTNVNLYAKTITSYENEKRVWEDQQKLSAGFISALQRQVKVEKRKRTLTVIGAILTIGGTLFFSLR